MKKIFALFLFLYISTTALNAQFKPIAESPVFDEPEHGLTKLLQMKDGSTMFFYVDSKKSMALRIYTPTHQEKIQAAIEPPYGKKKTDEVKAIFEIDGNAVLFVASMEDKTPVLYRLVVDGKTGALKESKKILELTKLGSLMASMQGSIYFPTFHIRKDPASNNYAIATTNAMEVEKNKRIQLLLFDGNHKETSRAYCALPNDKFESLFLVDMTMVGPDKVALLAYGDNSYKSKSDQSGLVLAILDNTLPNIHLTELPFSQNLDAKLGLLRYNPISKKIIVLTAMQEKKSRYSDYIPQLALVSPETQAIEKTFIVSATDNIMEKSVGLFGRKSAFSGLPQNLYINNDGTMTIVSQELTNTSGSMLGAEMGNIAVVNYSSDGKPITGFLIPKKQYFNNRNIFPFDVSKDEQTPPVLGGGSQFKFFTYFNHKGKSYILVNDLEKNDPKLNNGKVKGVDGLGDCDGFYFPLSGEAAIPERYFFFEQMSGANDYNIAMFSIADFDPINNLYITLKVERRGRSKYAKLVWLQL